MAKLIILEPAQRELEEFAILHMNLVGLNSARKITNLILDTLSRLELFPLSGPLPEDGIPERQKLRQIDIFFHLHKESSADK